MGQSCYDPGMDLSVPYTAVVPKIAGRVLMVLAGTTLPLSGREVARLARGSQNAVSLTLRRLVEHGLVRVQEAGRGAALLYTLNRDHLAADAVLILADLRNRLFARLAEELRSWPIQPLHASVFGSAARGDGDTASDVDLFIVRAEYVDEDDEQWQAQMHRLSDDVERWTGNHAGIAEVSEADVRKLRRDRPRVVDEISKDAIVLVGADAQELLGATTR